MANTQPYVALCLLTQRHNAPLELHVSRGIEKTPRREPFRELEALVVKLGAGAALRENLRDATLDLAAERLLLRLAKIPRFAAGS